MTPIIKSVIDTDLYKLTMQSAVVQKFPHAMAEYTFINRANTRFPPNFHVRLQEQVEAMRDLALTSDEKAFLRLYSYFPPTYLDLLEGYRFNPDEVSIDMTGNPENLTISIDGPWYRTILWEVPLMALISELYFRETGQQADSSWVERTQKKADQLRSDQIRYIDFGTRRRFSFDVQNRMVMEHMDSSSFLGTSNVLLGMWHHLQVWGTQAHEWIQAHAALYGFEMANMKAMQNWYDVYDGDLGIVLTDTFTTRDFFRSFTRHWACLYDGVRHDSGDPIYFADRMIRWYKHYGIDPKTKTIVFSDSLNVELVKQIAAFCQDKIKFSFGIGTNLSNDVGVHPLNMVIKLTGLSPREGLPLRHCVKLSDVAGKHTGDPAAIQRCLDEINTARDNESLL